MNATSKPKATMPHTTRLLRLEAAAMLALSLLLYAKTGASWGLFAALFLLPDLSLLAYAIHARIGAKIYNLAHAKLGALALVGAGVALPSGSVLAWGLIWLAHIGFDRMLGYGLKEPGSFVHTHLGEIRSFKRSASDRQASA
jgi:Domain of unknown function (DUF4260)